MYMFLARLTLSGGAYLIPICPASGRRYVRPSGGVHHLFRFLLNYVHLFPGSVPNFVLFRILKFRFSDFFNEFSSNFH